MPLTTEHPQYQIASPRWTRCRDVIEGEDAVKGKGKTYLPDLGHATAADNASYRMRAPWYGAVSRTITGLIGCVFRVPPAVTAPALIAEQAVDATLTGVSLPMLSQSLFRDVLSVGRAAIQIDMTPDGSRPYWRPVKAESLLNWRTEVINGSRILTRAIIKESIQIPNPNDPFLDKTIDEIRVLELVDGRAIESRWRQVEHIGPNVEPDISVHGWAMVEPPTVLLRRGQPLPVLPFVILGVTEVGTEIQRPPLLDMVDLALSLFRTQADLEWGAHRTALPTPIIIGADTEGGAPLGPGGVWMLPSGADAKMLEFTGAGLNSLAKLIDQKVAQIAALGARIIESSRRAAETAESVRLKTGSDTSLLSAIASAFEASMTTALRIHAWWAAATDDIESDSVSLALNRDFLDAKLAAPEITALVAAWQAGAIPLDTLHQNLLQGEIISQEVGIREVQRQLERERQERMERMPQFNPGSPPDNDSGDSLDNGSNDQEE